MASFEEAFLEVTQRVEDAFLSGVMARRSQLLRGVQEQVEGFYSDVSEAMGGETTPSEISAYTSWSGLTDKWASEKAKYHTSGYYNFLKGKTKTLSVNLRAAAGKSLHGDPTVTITEGIGAGFTKASGRVRVSRGFPGAGRFASNLSALRAVISVVPFPNVDKDEDVLKPFQGKTRLKLDVGEFGSSPRRPARPFLVPFMRYYVDKKIPDVITRTLKL